MILVNQVAGDRPYLPNGAPTSLRVMHADNLEIVGQLGFPEGCMMIGRGTGNSGARFSRLSTATRLSRPSQ